MGAQRKIFGPIDVLITSWTEPPIRNAWLTVVDERVESVSCDRPDVPPDHLEEPLGLVAPGFVAAHHHLYQGASRGIHVRGGLIDWLAVHYAAWARMTAEDVKAAAEYSLVQLLLGGCTTVAAFEYLHPVGEDFVSPVVSAARDAGIRMMYVRGCSPRLEGDLATLLRQRNVDVDRLVESEKGALSRTSDVISEAQTDFLRWACGPTTPVVDDGGIFNRALDGVAARHATYLHTHFHPLQGSLPQGISAADFAVQLGLVREGNWFAHGSKLTPEDVAKLGSQGVGVVHNPSCSSLLGYRIPRLADWWGTNNRIAISVDGAASNDRGSMLSEVQLAWQLQAARAANCGEFDAPPDPSQFLASATSGAARTINWPELGELLPGRPADFLVLDLANLDFAGIPGIAWNTPDVALFRANSQGLVQHLFVGGEQRVRNGRVLGLDQDTVGERVKGTADHLYLPPTR